MTIRQITKQKVENIQKQMRALHKQKDAGKLTHEQFWAKYEKLDEKIRIAYAVERVMR